MLKKLCFGGAVLAIAFICVGVMAIAKAKSSEADASKAAQSINGLPVGPILTPVAPPMLTRDQLVTPGNADDKEEIADLFAAYIFYHDSHNGPGVASLFTDDGGLETLWNNGGKTVEANPGATGKGCMSYGHEQIAKFFGNNPLPFVGHSHNQVSNIMIQVHGDKATMYANWTTIRSSDDKPAPGAVAPNTAVVSHNGEYVSDLRHTPAGWRFFRHRVLEDERGVTPKSDPPCPPNPY